MNLLDHVILLLTAFLMVSAVDGEVSLEELEDIVCRHRLLKLCS